MRAFLPLRAPSRWWRRVSRRLAIWAALCAALLVWVSFSSLPLDLPRIVEAIGSYEHLALDVQIVAAVVLVVAAAQLTDLDRYLWHMTANALALERPRALAKVWVVDGDTLDGDGVRYRLANIDSPETGENAGCFRERERGEEAKRAAIELVRSAQIVSVRRTWRTDIYGRRIAFVLIDGADLGRLLVGRGLARPWRGKRHRWCGARGGLAKMARASGQPHACSTCSSWR